MTRAEDIVFTAGQMAMIAAERGSMWGINVAEDKHARWYRKQRRHLIGLSMGATDPRKDVRLPDDFMQKGIGDVG